MPESKGSSLVFIKDKDLAWIPAIQTGGDAKKANVDVPQYPDEQSICCDGGKGRKMESKSVNLKDYAGGVLPLQNVDAGGNLIPFPDMVELPYSHEAAILFNLKRRHGDALPYTRTGDIIIAINPFQWLTHLYTEKERTIYSNTLVWAPPAADGRDPRTKVAPHVYETSSLVYRGLAFDKHAQSILVSGESGAGKTETVKICMNHIASVQRGPIEPTGDDKFEDPVVNRILRSNPLLESFGNAKTTRNDNSSRFGKYLQLQFHDHEPNAPLPDLSKSTCFLVGSKCETYLLEKNRITGHEDSERTYHVLYQIAAAPDDAKKMIWDKLLGKTETSYKYVGKSPPNTLIDGMTDEEHYINTTNVLDMIKVNGDKLKALYTSIAAVMACGNLTFGEKDGDADKSSCTTPADCGDLAALLGVSPDVLELAFTERTMKTRNESYKVPLNPQVAKESCDAFAKEIYAKLFDWLVVQINAATSAEINYEEKTNIEYGIIGLLDIFGFESFKINRFEQLCINFANEKLQQKFTEDIFQSVQKEYEEEGIDLDEIAYDDNSDVLELIEGRTGICAMLNEECVRPKGDDKTFVNKALSANKKSPCLIINPMNREAFGVHHFAGKVMYSAEFFVARNQDSLPSDLEDCLMASTNFIVSLKKEDPAAKGGKAPKRTKSNLVGSTVWNKYKVQMAALMGSLRKTRSRYIRCLKPNKAKVPIKLEHMSTVEQLRCAGVVAAVTITRSAFPNRLDNEAAKGRFEFMWDKKAFPVKDTGGMDDVQKLAAVCEALFTSALKEKEEGGKQAFVVGKTKTYFRLGALEFLENTRGEKLGGVVAKIQSLVRGHLGRLAFRRMFFAKEEAERLAREEAEREEREKREAAERAEREERERKEAAERAEREKREAAERAEREKREAAERAAREEQERIEREERERKEAEERKKREEEERKAREKEAKKQKLLKLKREKEEEAARKKAEEEERKAMEAKKKELEKMEKELGKEKKKQEAEIKKAEKELAEVEENVKDLQAKYDKLMEEANKLPQKDLDKLQKKSAESDKIVKFLKKENTRLRNETEQMEEDLTKMKETNNRLIEANASAGASLETLNKQAKVLKDHNKKLEKSIGDFKQANKKLEHDLKGRQAYYEAETKIRTDYEGAMEKIVKLMEERCDDSELVEKVMTAQLTCVTNIARGDTIH